MRKNFLKGHEFCPSMCFCIKGETTELLSIMEEGLQKGMVIPSVFIQEMNESGCAIDQVYAFDSKEEFAEFQKKYTKENPTDIILTSLVSYHGPVMNALTRELVQKRNKEDQKKKVSVSTKKEEKKAEEVKAPSMADTTSDTATGTLPDKQVDVETTTSSIDDNCPNEDNTQMAESVKESEEPENKEIKEETSNIEDGTSATE